LRYTGIDTAASRPVATVVLIFPNLPTSPPPFSQEPIMLQKCASFPGIQGPIVTIVMDGYGIAESDVGSAIAAATKPTLDRLFANYPNITLRAHGVAVGMPSDEDMGNSEVGHNAIGAGQVYSQGASLVADAIAAGSIWQGAAWQEVIASVPKPGAG
jgi:2,3-bisphosphoglycerate-independent phosphoglycerate mutase